MENCSAMHVLSPVQKRHRTKNSYMKKYTWRYLVIFDNIQGSLMICEVVWGYSKIFKDIWSERMQIVTGHADLLQIEVPWKVPREVCRILDKESSETIKCWLHQFPYAFRMLVPKRPSPYHTSIPHPPFLSVLQLTPSLSHQMENCWVMHVHSPVEKRHRTKNSYRKPIVFKVVCGDISKSELVLGTLIQRLKNSNFRVHLQSLSHQMGICSAMPVL